MIFNLYIHCEEVHQQSPYKYIDVVLHRIVNIDVIIK